LGVGRVCSWAGRSRWWADAETVAGGPGGCCYQVERRVRWGAGQVGRRWGRYDQAAVTVGRATCRKRQPIERAGGGPGAQVGGAALVRAWAGGRRPRWVPEVLLEVLGRVVVPGWAGGPSLLMRWQVG